MSSSIGLDGRFAIVTGGASGIGLACAKLLRRRGARVAVVDVNAQSLEQACHGEPGFLPVLADNRSITSIEAAFAGIRSKTERIDVFVNSAGVSGFSLPIDAIGEDDFDRMMATHVKGAFFWVRAALPHKADGGRIINIASDFAMTGFPSMSHYVAAKSALLGLTKAWAREFAARRITVNAVAPGLIATPMTRESLGEAALGDRGERIPLGRLALPEEIAFAVAWLASAEAAMMTGQTLSPNAATRSSGYERSKIAPPYGCRSASSPIGVSIMPGTSAAAAAVMRSSLTWTSA